MAKRAGKGVRGRHETVATPWMAEFINGVAKLACVKGVGNGQIHPSVPRRGSNPVMKAVVTDSGVVEVTLLGGSSKQVFIASPKGGAEHAKKQIDALWEKRKK